MYALELGPYPQIANVCHISISNNSVDAKISTIQPDRLVNNIHDFYIVVRNALRHAKIYTTQNIQYIKNTNNLVREIHGENNERDG